MALKRKKHIIAKILIEIYPIAGRWGEIHVQGETTVKGGDDCLLHPDCELSGTKCCNSGEFPIFTLIHSV